MSLVVYAVIGLMGLGFSHAFLALLAHLNPDKRLFRYAITVSVLCFFGLIYILLFVPAPR